MSKGIGAVIINVTDHDVLEAVNVKRKLKGQPTIRLAKGAFKKGLVPLNYNSTVWREDCLNIGHLQDLELDVECPLPGSQMGLPIPDGSVSKLYCWHYLHKVHADCELTHTFQAFYRALSKRGKLYIAVPDMMYFAEQAVKAQRDEVAALRWEHSLFSYADRSGLFFNQSLITPERIEYRAKYAGFKTVTIEPATRELLQIVDPDEIDLYPEQQAKITDKENRDAKEKNLCALYPLGCNERRTVKETNINRSKYCRRHRAQVVRRFNRIYEEHYAIRATIKKT